MNYDYKPYHATFYLICNAQSEADVDTSGEIRGRDLEVPLTPEGERQAVALGEAFRKKGVKFTRVFSSSADCARSTADICLSAMGQEGFRVREDRRFLGQYQGDFIGRPTSLYKQPRIADEMSWNFVPGDIHKGESQKDVGARMIDWYFDEIRRCIGTGCEHHIALFTHSSAIKPLLAMLSKDPKIPEWDAYRIIIENASVTEFTNTRDDGITIVSGITLGDL